MTARYATLSAALLALLLTSCGSLSNFRASAGPDPAATRGLALQVLPAQLADREGWPTIWWKCSAHCAWKPSTQHCVPCGRQRAGVRLSSRSGGSRARTHRAEEIETRAAQRCRAAGAGSRALNRTSATGETYRKRLDRRAHRKAVQRDLRDFISVVPLGDGCSRTTTPCAPAGRCRSALRSRRAPRASVAIRSAPTRACAARSSPAAAGCIRHGKHLSTTHLGIRLMLYRFAVSTPAPCERNAAFQSAVALVAGRRLALDGDLLIDGGESDAVGQTEQAVRFPGHPPAIDERARSAATCNAGSGADLRTHRNVREGLRARRQQGRARSPPRPVPDIVLQVRRSRALTTDCFARRVADRQQRCIARASAK